MSVTSKKSVNDIGLGIILPSHFYEGNFCNVTFTLICDELYETENASRLNMSGTNVYE